MLLDFHAESSTLVVGGRRFTVRRPTLGAVLMALELFGREIRSAVTTLRGKELEERDVHAILKGVVESTAVRPRLPRLLDAIAEGEGDPADWPALEIVKRALSMCDVSRIAASFRFGEASPPAAGGYAEEPPDQDAGLLFLAEQFTTTPVAIMAWPYEAFLTVCERRVAEADSKPRPVAPTIFGATPLRVASA